ncbi:hypothetical protein HYC85_000631 [Camellia sinensis]|uniref:Folylpolyglutamate synthase n=1 Tax=Camellia sinensis TaxID=4442 RepID=A0A7J7I318_CAMSI|nr:hypothetical protein HYC85_000631 [Camellia sinensis]
MDLAKGRIGVLLGFPNISMNAALTVAWIGEKTSDDIPMPTYFRFLALLAFKIFAAEQVDVAILEVGLGGKFDATNVASLSLENSFGLDISDFDIITLTFQVQKPIVCGITSLGYDHMEILGNTLGEIAGEKAGIFKQGVPAFTVHQPDEAMRVLEEKASQLDVHLQVAPLLDVSLLNGLHLGLSGEHQYLNAGLAIALCSTWLQRTGHIKVNYLDQTSSLPEQFIKGLTTATLQGRAQIVPDRLIDIESPGDLVFYMDGAHSPESMEVCAKWFCLAIKEENKQQNLSNHRHDNSSADHKLVDSSGCKTPMKNSTQILLFNCMSVRDPQLLLPRLINTCANHGNFPRVHFKKALFVPNISVYNKVWSSASPPPDLEVDLSWQLTLQKVWENLIKSEKGTTFTRYTSFSSGVEGMLKMQTLSVKVKMIRKGVLGLLRTALFSLQLPLAIKWLRDTVQQHKSVRFQVIAKFLLRVSIWQLRK